MPGDNVLDQIVAIDPHNLFLKYIVGRIQDDDYRGIHISQHNRYDLERLEKILGGIHSVVDGDRFRVPVGDDDGSKESGCEDYYKVVENINSIAGIGTINSIKKNFFVDFDRAGLLLRFDKKGDIIPHQKRGQVYYAQLTEPAIKLINSRSIAEKYKIFTDALDELFGGEITNIAETLYYSDYKNDAIGLTEFMLILSDDRPAAKTLSKIELISSYRTLKRWQQDKAIELIKIYCNPDNFRTGNKTAMRDFGNWRNESQQIFTLLKNTVYFDITRSSLRLNTGTYGIFDERTIRTMRRLGVKQEYLTKHKLEKIENFELHHVVPFSAARNKSEFQLVDNWKNLLYLERMKHAEITKNKNKNIVLFADKDALALDDFDHNRITASNGTEVVYNGTLAVEMQKHNRELLKDIYEYKV